MRYLLVLLLFCIFTAIISCNKTPSSITNSSFSDSISQKPANEHTVEIAKSHHTGKVVHVLVALCDNINQGIVPVPARLGNGEDLQNNLYWGAAYGVKSFFIRKDSDWQLISSIAPLNQFILERCIFKHKKREVYLIADAYKGAEIKRCISDFFEYAAGNQNEKVIDQ